MLPRVVLFVGLMLAPPALPANPTITNLIVDASGVAVAWNGTNSHYILELAPAIGSSGWNLVGDVSTVADTWVPRGGAPAFYRVRVVRPISIPDPLFRSIIDSSLPVQHEPTGTLYHVDVDLVTNLWAINAGLSNLSGLTEFRSLKELRVHDNALESLSLTGAPALVHLDCGDNSIGQLNAAACPSLVTLACYGNEMTNLNLAGLTRLSVLDCYDNGLPTLSLFSCTNLHVVDCSVNSLTFLYLSNQRVIEELYCYENLITSLVSTSSPALRVLRCYYNNLTNLVVISPALEELICDGNALTRLDLSTSTNVRSLYCPGNVLTNLNLTGCVALEELDCSRNNLSNLTLSGASNLFHFVAAQNVMTGVVNLAPYPDLLHVDLRSNLITEIILADTNFPPATFLHDVGVAVHGP